MIKYGFKTLLILFAAVAAILLSACSGGNSSQSKFVDSNGKTHTIKNLPLSDMAKKQISEKKAEIEHKSLDDITYYGVYPNDNSDKLIILIHSSDSEKEEFIAQMCRYAADGYHCVAFDIKGFGERKLSKKTMVVQLTVETVKDVDLLLDYYEKNYNIKKFALEGYSFGGSVAYQYCVDGKRTPSAIAVGSSSPDLTQQPNSSIKDGEFFPPFWREEKFKTFTKTNNPMNNKQKFDKLPLIVSHYTGDRLVSSNGDRALEKYLYKVKNKNAVFCFYEGNEHNVPEKFVRQILPFFDKHIV